MRKVFIKIIFVIGLPVGFSISYYNKLAVYYEKETMLKIKMDYLYRPGYKPDIIFLGSSRVLDNIDPHVIDSVCSMRSYNLGAEQAEVGEMRMLFSVCIERGKIPKVVVVNIDPSSLQVDKPIFDFPDILFYAEKDTVVYDRMAPIEDVYAHKWKYPFYRLQQLMSVNDGFKVYALINGKQAFRGEIRAMDAMSTDVLHENGFFAHYDPYEDIYVNPFNEKFQEKGFDLLQDIVDTCRQRGIRVIFITAPMYSTYREIYLNSDAILSRVSELARKDSVPYFNMIDDSLSRHKENFYNFVHLNGWGAEKFSLEVARLLKGMDTVAHHPNPKIF
jgi:hypothetical protein